MSKALAVFSQHFVISNRSVCWEEMDLFVGKRYACGRSCETKMIMQACQFSFSAHSHREIHNEKKDFR